MRPSRGWNTFACRCTVATTYVPRLERHREALARDRREAHARLGHEVADDVRLPEHALLEQRLLRVLARAEEEPRDLVHLDARVLLRHGHVAAAEPGLDVRERDVCLRRRPRARECRGRVAVDEDEVGLLGADHRLDRGRHHVHVGRVQVESVARLRQAELLEEDVGELAVVVLTRVHETSSIPVMRKPTESGALFTNCGRFPTTVRTFKPTGDYWPAVAGQ